MFSVLAWSRAFAFALLLSALTLCNAQVETLFASSVTYCQPPETLLVQRFEIAYFPQNNSVVFNASISSVQPNVNVSANVALNVYGKARLNITIDLCNLLKGVLCPLPMYNFTGADTLTLPPSLTIPVDIPSIVYKIPDLEGFFQLVLTEVDTGAVKACIQATISNGRSAHQPAVEWATGAIALAALFSAGWYSFASPEATVPFRFLELIYLYQSIASSSLLSLNYPSVYRAFSLNFAWAIGLIPSSKLQNSIDHMRHLTGGHLADATDGSAIGLVNRKLSPYDFHSPVLASPLARFSRSLNTENTALALRDTITGGVQTVTSKSSNVLEAGVPIFVNTIHIATANAFMTVFIFVLGMFAIAIAIFILGYGSIFASDRIRGRNKGSVSHPFSSKSLSFVRGWFLRLSLLGIFPLLIFIFYQWTLKDSWLSILISVLTLLTITVLVAYPAFQTLRVVRRESSSSSLYAHNELHLSRNGALYAQYRPSRYFFFLILLGGVFLRAILIAFAQANGDVQLSLMIVFEFLLVAAHLALKPFKTRGGDVFLSYLAITRFACTALMIAFLETLNVPPITRVVVGIFIAVIFSVSVIVVFLNLVLHTVGGLLRRNRENLPVSSSSAGSSTGSMLEKGNGEGSKTPSDSEKQISSGDVSSGDSPNPQDDRILLADGVVRERPLNPTPNQSTVQVLPYPENNNPYPLSPTGTTVSTMDPPTPDSRDSGTITVGSLLSRRWSFLSFSRASSPFGPSMGHPSHQNSLSPSPLPTTPVSSENGAHSRDASLTPRHQHDDIQEEPGAKSSTILAS